MSTDYHPKSGIPKASRVHQHGLNDFRNKSNSIHAPLLDDIIGYNVRI
jgi:hypothetical protein